MSRVKQAAQSHWYTVFYLKGLFLLLPVILIAVPAWGQSSWSLLKDENANATIRAMSYGAGLFVAVGDSGLVWTSGNGSSWTARNSNTTSNLYAVCYGGGQFVAVGKEGTVVTSTSGTQWTLRVYPGSAGARSLTCIAYNGSIYVAGGTGGRLRTSSDGISWANHDIGTLNELRGMCYGNGMFIASSSGGNIYKSTNGTQWTGTNISDKNFYSAVYGNGLFIAGGERGACFTSTDGNNWTERETGYGNYLMALIYTGTTYIACGNSDGYSLGSMIIYSSNGINWTRPNLASLTSRTLLALAHNGDLAIASGAKSVIIGSDLAGTGTASISVTSPASGTALEVGSYQDITWTSSNFYGELDIQYSTDGGKNWITLEYNSYDDGSHTWMVPDSPSGNCLVRVRDSEDGSPSATSGVFSIVAGDIVRVMKPNGGESWQAGTSQGITWTSEGNVSAVKLEYSLDNGDSYTSITSSTSNDGSFSWTIPSGLDSTSCRVRISATGDGAISDASDSVFTIHSPPGLSLDKEQLNFGYVSGGTLPPAQPLGIINSGGGTLDWTVSGDAAWLAIDQGAGQGDAYINIGVIPSGLVAGTYTGTVTVSDPAAVTGPVSVAVSLTLKGGTEDFPPFGVFASPVHNTVVSGSIPVTGWVLDDVDVQGVKIYHNETSYIGDAVLVEGARPDIAEAYPGYPYNSRAGWGYMLLTNALPDGTYRISAVAEDSAGNEVELGYAVITIQNAGAVIPFGAIDSPAQGGDAWGDRYVNWGWALTPPNNSLATDGSTITVWVDSLPLGTLDGYSISNGPVENLFPGYLNSSGPAGYFYLDTTQYTNGPHSIAWTVTDSAGNSAGIGSRFFNVRNTGADTVVTAFGQVSAAASAGAAKRSISPVFKQVGAYRDRYTLESIPPADGGLELLKGFSRDREPEVLPGDRHSQVTVIGIKEGERMELRLNDPSGVRRRYDGFMMVGDVLGALPAGSSMDEPEGVFYWLPGPGFIGDYELVFIGYNEEERCMVKRVVLIRISPRFSS